MKVLSFAMLLVLFAAFIGQSHGIGCSVCVAFMDDFEGELLDLVLQIGISEGCHICSRISSRLGQEVCGALCEVVGIETFVHILQEKDIDPIYVCTEVSNPKCLLLLLCGGRGSGGALIFFFFFPLLPVDCLPSKQLREQLHLYRVCHCVARFRPSRNSICGLCQNPCPPGDWNRDNEAHLAVPRWPSRNDWHRSS